MCLLNSHEAIVEKTLRTTSALVELKYDLEMMMKQNPLKRIFGKDRISTTLQDHKDALQASYNALQTVREAS